MPAARDFLDLQEINLKDGSGKGMPKKLNAELEAQHWETEPAKG